MYDTNLEKAVKKHRRYFHITAVKNIDSIKKNGIKADENGHIFVIIDMKVSESVACLQLGLINEFAVFRIDSMGITGKVIMDRVAEFEAPYQRIIIQKKISKRYIDFMCSLIPDLEDLKKKYAEALRISCGLCFSLD